MLPSTWYVAVFGGVLVVPGICCRYCGAVLDWLIYCHVRHCWSAVYGPLYIIAFVVLP